MISFVGNCDLFSLKLWRTFFFVFLYSVLLMNTELSNWFLIHLTFFLVYDILKFNLNGSRSEFYLLIQLALWSLSIWSFMSLYTSQKYYLSRFFIHVIFSSFLLRFLINRFWLFYIHSPYFNFSLNLFVYIFLIPSWRIPQNYLQAYLIFLCVFCLT